MKLLLVIACITMLVSCKSVSLSDDGGMVKQITEEQATACRLITDSHINNITGVGIEACKQNAHIRIKNLVAELSGNAYTVTFEHSAICIAGGTGVSFNAYQCQ